MSRAQGTRPVTRDEVRAAAIEEVLRHLHAAVDGLGQLLREQGSPAPSIPLPHVMKPSEYADHLRVSVRKVHSWIEQGMPHFKVEDRIRISVVEADAWVKSRPVVPDRDGVETEE